MGFPDDDMYGVDVVIPDVSWLVKNRARIRGIFLTHGHEDHIGALPYVMDQLSAPIYATRLTAGLVELKLQERGLADKTKIHIIKPGDRLQAGCFSVEPIHVNHSIADSVAYAILTPAGTGGPDRGFQDRCDAAAGRNDGSDPVRRIGPGGGTGPAHGFHQRGTARVYGFRVPGV